MRLMDGVGGLMVFFGDGSEQMMDALCSARSLAVVGCLDGGSWLVVGRMVRFKNERYQVSLLTKDELHEKQIDEGPFDNRCQICSMFRMEFDVSDSRKFSVLSG